jgi:hypothetical protein
MSYATIILTAALSLAAGAGGTYATIHVTAACQGPVLDGNNDATKAFLAPPPPPITGTSYK